MSRELSPRFLGVDSVALIGILNRREVRFLVVGGYAVIFHGHARYTGDIDIYFECTPKNARALHGALTEFWAGPVPGVENFEEWLETGVVVQFGRPPNRII